MSRAPEMITKGLKFLGEHAPRPPSTGVTDMLECNVVGYMSYSQTIPPTFTFVQTYSLLDACMSL